MSWMHLDVARSRRVSGKLIHKSSSIARKKPSECILCLIFYPSKQKVCWVELAIAKEPRSALMNVVKRCGLRGIVQ